MPRTSLTCPSRGAESSLPFILHRSKNTIPQMKNDQANSLLKTAPADHPRYSLWSACNPFAFSKYGLESFLKHSLLLGRVSDVSAWPRVTSTPRHGLRDPSCLGPPARPERSASCGFSPGCDRPRLEQGKKKKHAELQAQNQHLEPCQKQIGSQHSFWQPGAASPVADAAKQS